ncbi:MAPEG family protein [Defluviimonas aestuarii]|uniref:MAPEG family protein n=1 Tax=Albidovulum aestuarii TaxID=1130726 RepID=UPI00249A15C5|nr:MAPEG family protein [Defluviimonas aestuarii]MDI3335935.1 MAPEG family protein [Defluviimonas aestuarii]
MTFEVTGLYAAILGLMMIVLQILAIAARAKNETLFGDAGEMRMILPIRRHGNFIETVPMALIVMALAEAQGLSVSWLHGAGVLLVASRLIHPFGLAETKKALPVRIAGIVGTWIATLIPIAALFSLM